MSGSSQRLIARGIARAFLAGEWERSALVARASESLGIAEGEQRQWLWRLVDGALLAHPTAPADTETLAQLVAGNASFQGGWARRRIRILRRAFPEAARMREPRWPVRKLETLKDVAAWLAVSPEQLDWFADRQGRERRASSAALQHYSYAWVPKRSGGARLLEAPKSISSACSVAS